MKFSRVTAGAVALAMSLGSISAPAQARDPFIGEIMTFAGTFCPRGWAQAAGQYLPISGNEALFSVIGTTYGGDGRRTFALPDLRGRVIVGPGSGPGLSSYSLGQRGGVETNPTSVRNAAKPEGETVQTPMPQFGAQENRQPYVAIHSCIALQGIYPPRS